MLEGPAHEGLAPGGFIYTAEDRRNLSEVTIYVPSFKDIVSGTDVVHQDAQGGTSEWPKKLKSDSCVISPGVQNCSVACTDKRLLFGSIDTLTNCLLLATAALFVQNGYPALGLGNADNVTQLSGVPSLADFDGTRVLNEVVQCAVGACQDTSLGTCSASTLSLENATAGFHSLDTVLDGLKHYCDDVPVGVNADIAGPGVSGNSL